MKTHRPIVDSLDRDSPKWSADTKPSESVEGNLAVSVATGSIARQRMRVAGQLIGSLLLGGAAILGSMLVFRKGLLPLVEVVFHLGPDALSVVRRTGILLTAVGGYWVFVCYRQHRPSTELRFRPIHMMLGGASGAAMVALPMALLFAVGAYEAVLFRGASQELLGVAAVIGIAATLEELTYRCLLFQLMERSWGTKFALTTQAVIFALQHLENVAQGGTSDAVTMLVAVTLTGLLWGSVFILTRNLWVVAAHHAAWNFTILLSGVPLSGIEDWRALAPLESRFAGPDWLTGGMFGPESSLLVMASTAVAIVLLLRAARQRQTFLPTAESHS